ncbi:MAG: hypothetical protein MK193_00600 [Lentisphaeria bacterium]|nr:hypothetical protein [Lentisphaeria bacterium]
MHGNAWKWCQDWSFSYDNKTLLNPIGPSNSKATELELRKYFLGDVSGKKMQLNCTLGPNETKTIFLIQSLQLNNSGDEIFIFEGDYLKNKQTYTEEMVFENRIIIFSP